MTREPVSVSCPLRGPLPAVLVPEGHPEEGGLGAPWPGTGHSEWPGCQRASRQGRQLSSGPAGPPVRQPTMGQGGQRASGRCRLQMTGASLRARLLRGTPRRSCSAGDGSVLRQPLRLWRVSEDGRLSPVGTSPCRRRQTGSSSADWPSAHGLPEGICPNRRARRVLTAPSPPRKSQDFVEPTPTCRTPPPGSTPELTASRRPSALAAPCSGVLPVRPHLLHAGSLPGMAPMALSCPPGAGLPQGWLGRNV